MRRRARIVLVSKLVIISYRFVVSWATRTRRVCCCTCADRARARSTREKGGRVVVKSTTAAAEVLTNYISGGRGGGCLAIRPGGLLNLATRYGGRRARLSKWLPLRRRRIPKRNDVAPPPVAGARYGSVDGDGSGRGRQFEISW